MNLPTGVLISEGRLIVAHAWHHRILVWDRVREQLNATGFPLHNPMMRWNRTWAASCSAASLYWPFGIGLVGSVFWVADTGTEECLAGRVVCPNPAGRQISFSGSLDSYSHQENRGDQVGPASFRWPHAITGSDDMLLTSPTRGDHRVLGWSPTLPGIAAPTWCSANRIFFTANEWAVRTAVRHRFRYPVRRGQRVQPALPLPILANIPCVLLWDSVHSARPSPPITTAQPTFQTNGENRWNAVTPIRCAGRTGSGYTKNLLAVADSATIAVMIWRRP